ncbi:MAG: hypothetical protein ACJ8BF_06310 [Gemmatimonadales bacterium]
MTVDPGRMRLIRERLQNQFYEAGRPSERIAAAVLLAVQDLDQAPLPR